MSMLLMFWILMFLWAVFGIWGWYAPDQRYWYGHGVFLFVLFLLLGWAVFGAPIKG